MRAVVAGIAIAGVLAAEAESACRAVPAADQARLAPLVFTGVVESGPLTPAVLRVELWEKGSGPDRVALDTGQYADYALGDSIAPQPGERWRIFGEPDGDLVATGTCWGSVVVAADPVAPLLAAGPRRIAMARSTWTGVGMLGRPPLVSAPVGTRLRLAQGVLGVRVLGTGRKRASASRRSGRFTVRVPARRTLTLVADTGTGFFAARVRAIR